MEAARPPEPDARLVAISRVRDVSQSASADWSVAVRANVGCFLAWPNESSAVGGTSCCYWQWPD